MIIRCEPPKVTTLGNGVHRICPNIDHPVLEHAIRNGGVEVLGWIHGRVVAPTVLVKEFVCAHSPRNKRE
jgi:hypothetical protein